MRRILAISVAAAVPATLPAVAAGAQSRPVPPSLRAHHRPINRLWTDHHRRSADLIGAPATAGAPPAARDRTAERRFGARPQIRLLPLGYPAPVAPSAPASSAAPAASPGRTAAAHPASPATEPGGAAGREHGRSRAHEPAYGQAPTRLLLRTTVGSAAPRTVTLLCDPPGGTHPKAAQACADLARSHGSFKVPSAKHKPRACFMIYSPVTVSAEGRWRGEDVQFTARFPNTCVMRGQTGAIFDF
jgi:hypothetical protein